MTHNFLVRFAEKLALRPIWLLSSSFQHISGANYLSPIAYGSRSRQYQNHDRSGRHVVDKIIVKRFGEMFDIKI